MSNTTGEMKAVEACYNCAGPLLDERFEILLSDAMDIYPHGKWLKQKYCCGEGTLNCASMPTEERRGPLFDEWVTYDLKEIRGGVPRHATNPFPSNPSAKAWSEDDACDE